MKVTGTGPRVLAISSAALLLVFFLGVNLAAQTKTSLLGAAGTTWGGQHLELEVTPEGANLEFDCATGTIALPMTVDAQGNFSGKGTISRERPGPVMRDSPNSTGDATFSGVLKGNTLKLHISSPNWPADASDFVLVRGQAGRVLRCK